MAASKGAGNTLRRGTKHTIGHSTPGLKTGMEVTVTDYDDKNVLVTYYDSTLVLLDDGGSEMQDVPRVVRLTRTQFDKGTAKKETK